MYHIPYLVRQLVYGADFFLSAMWLCFGGTEFFTDIQILKKNSDYMQWGLAYSLLNPIHIRSLFPALSLLLYLTQTHTTTAHTFKKMALISLDRAVCPLPQISAALPFHGAWPRRVIILLSQVKGELMSEETDVPVSYPPPHTTSHPFPHEACRRTHCRISNMTAPPHKNTHPFTRGPS